MNKSEKIKFTVLVVALFSVLTIIYYPSFNTPFAFDDQHAIVDNGQIQTLENPGRFFTDPRAISVLPTNQVYRPISVLSIALDYYFAGGLDPKVFHRNAYIVFCLQLVAMFFLIRQLLEKTFPKESPNFQSFTSVLITSLYGFNTALAETLNYTVARSDSYSTFFTVCTLALFIGSDFARKYHLYLFPMLLGALTKETGATVPGLIFIYSFLFSENNNFRSRTRSAFFNTLPSFVLISAYILLYLTISIATPPRGTTTLPYFATQVYVTAHYFLMFFLPVGLSADHGLRAFPNLLDDRIVLGGVLHCLLLLALIKGVFNRKFALTSFGIAWFYFALAPTSSIIPIDDVMNDHRMYYPFVGLSIAVGSIAVLFYQRFLSRLPKYYAASFVFIVSTLYLAGHAYGLSSRHNVWSTKENLWRDVTEKNPANARGLMNYGIQLMNKGELVKAREYFNRASRIWPKYSYLHLNLGILNSMENKDAEAEKAFKFAIKINPSNPTMYLHYANWLKKKARYNEALINADNVLFLSPNYAVAKKLKQEIQILSAANK